MAKINKVNIGVLDREKSEFDLSHTNNTTSDFGHVQTLMCEYIPLGDTSLNCKVDNFTRVSPLVAPTFGFIKNHNFFEYVKATDIYPYVNEVLAGTPVSLSNEESGTTSRIIQNLPYIWNWDLTLMLLMKMSVKVFVPRYTAEVIGGQYKGYRQLARSEFDEQRRNIFTDFCAGEREFDSMVSDYFINNFIPTYIQHDEDVENGITELIDNSLTPFNAQYVATFVRDIPIVDGGGATVSDKICYLCFYHTRESQTLLKHIIGCGYKPNLSILDNYKVSMMPLLSVAKAYFDIFSLVQYDNYKESVLFRLYEYYSHNTPYPYYGSGELPLFLELIDYLSNTSYSDDMDYLSAHQPLMDEGGTYDSYLPASPLYNDIHTFGYLNQPEGASSNQQNTRINAMDLQPALDLSSKNAWLTHLDIQMLQKMYLWVNRQSQCGYDIRNILVSRGYSQFCESAESQFLGHDCNTLRIDSVTSLSDTYDAETNSGKTLGEWAGQSAGGNDGKFIKFTANEIGYFICLNVVVPNTGYVGSLKPSVLGFNKWNLYNPEFDGFGYEFSPTAIVGRNDQIFITSGSNDNRTRYDVNTFGLIPRFSGYKIHADVANGDMSNNMYRDNYTPYYMERIFSSNRMLGGRTDQTISPWDIWQPNRNINIPNAGSIWRKTVTTPFMGNYNRIFQNFDDSVVKGWLNLPREDFYLPQDNFISHNTIVFKIWSRMLPIMDTFQTQEENGEGKHITISK